MRLDINLASTPYEDAQSFYQRAAVAVAAVVIVTVVLAFVVIQETRSSRQLGRELDAVNDQIRDLNRQKEEARAILERPENQGTRNQAQFVNSLLAQRAFSWTQVFADLEKIMPTRVHLVSINPELTKQNELAMKITVAGDSRDKAIELVHNLETSRHFRNAWEVSESNKPPGAAAAGGVADTVQVQISALYVPDVGETRKPSATEAQR